MELVLGSRGCQHTHSSRRAPACSEGVRGPVQWEPADPLRQGGINRINSYFPWRKAGLGPPRGSGSPRAIKPPCWSHMGTLGQGSSSRSHFHGSSSAQTQPSAGRKRNHPGWAAPHRPGPDSLHVLQEQKFKSSLHTSGRTEVSVIATFRQHNFN